MTDKEKLEKLKKLAEILLLESADIYYHYTTGVKSERIKKVLVDYFKRYKGQEERGGSTMFCGIPTDDILEWLEKQDKSAEINPDEIIEESHQDNADHIIDIVTEQGKPSEWSKEDENKYSATEAIKEEKVDNANKAEPKFKVGDWVVKKSGKNFHNGSKTIQFTKTDENACQFGSIRRLYEDKIRHWTIADAQDGDVLVSSDGSIFIFAGVVDCACKYYVSLTTRNYVKINKEVKGGYWETSRAVHPATKEQCALLFQKMREEEYEWDSEKKKLKKIMESNETN